jgi:hypothetical protein
MVCKAKEKRDVGDISRIPPESPTRKTCYFWVIVTDPTPIFRSRFNVTAVVPQAAL